MGRRRRSIAAEARRWGRRWIQRAAAGGRITRRNPPGELLHPAAASAGVCLGLLPCARACEGGGDAPRAPPSPAHISASALSARATQPPSPANCTLSLSSQVTGARPPRALRTAGCAPKLPVIHWRLATWRRSIAFWCAAGDGGCGVGGVAGAGGGLPHFARVRLGGGPLLAACPPTPQRAMTTRGSPQQLVRRHGHSAGDLAGAGGGGDKYSPKGGHRRSYRTLALALAALTAVALLAQRSWAGGGGGRGSGGGGRKRVEGEGGVEDDRGFGGQVQLLGYF